MREILLNIAVDLATSTKLGTFVVILGLGLVIGVVLSILVWQFHKHKSNKAEKTLKRNFGEPSTVTTFTLDEAVDWITAHDDLMKNGCDAAIFKVNNQTLKMTHVKFNLDFGANNYLVIIIRDKQSKSIKASLLVKYDKLDSNLESALKPGKGFMVIGD